MIEKQKRAQDISQRKAVPAMEQSSEKTILSFVPGTIVAVAGTGSRVEMNAENGALDPAPTTKGLPCLKTQKNTLTGTDAVIHGSKETGEAHPSFSARTQTGSPEDPAPESPAATKPQGS
jgi:hypothetical protein